MSGSVRELVVVLLLLALALPGASRGQGDSEAELKAARDAALEAYATASARAHGALLAQLGAAERRHGDQFRAVQQLEAQPAGVIRDRELRQARAALRLASDELARCQHQHADARAEEAVRRLALIRASSAWVDKLFQAIENMLNMANPRPQQAQQFEQLAMAELSRIEDLEHMAASETVERPPQIPSVDSTLLSDPQLEERSLLLADLAEAAARRVRELAPTRASLEARVQRLDRMVQRGAGGQRAPELLERARAELARVARLVDEQAQWAEIFARQVAELDAERDRRGVAPPAGGSPRQAGDE